MSPLTKGLLPHERQLLSSGLLQNETHPRSTSIWLKASSTTAAKLYELSNNTNTDLTTVFRHMADVELQYLLTNHALPSTQPYQTIVEGELGRKYCEKYFTGRKKVDTDVTTIVEFVVPCSVVNELFDIQHKAEDGVISMGLGNKAGNGLSLFNEALRKPGCSYRIVMVKRRVVR